MKQLLWYGIGLVILLVVIALISPGARPPSSSQSTATTSAAMSSPMTQYDFGSVSMAKGVVTREYQVTNTTNQPLLIDKVFTSCMCTQAELMIDGRTYGPFGMPGHGAVPRANATLPAGATATVLAQFDPAAHGPAGVGPVERVITLVDEKGGSLDLSFKATVTP